MKNLSTLISKLKAGITCMLALAAIGITTPVSANISSDGSDGAFELNTALTLPISGNTIFNFTTFSILSSGVLEFNGAFANDGISILATGDILIDGVLNASPYILSIATPGSITINGLLNFSNGLLLSASSISINGVITQTGSELPPFDRSPNPEFIIHPIIGHPDYSGLQPPPVPEPKTYGMLLTGLGLLGFIARRRKVN